MARFGLFLIVLVAWASAQLSRNKEQPSDHLLAGAAHLALAGVRVIGMLVDRLGSIPSLFLDSRGGRGSTSGRGHAHRTASNAVS
jgi:hypothetical protein